MMNPFLPYLIPLLASAVLVVVLVLFAWQRRPAPGVGYFILMMLATAVWLIGHALEFKSLDLGEKVFWANIQYFGIVSLPVFWLLFAMEYTGRTKFINRRNITLLFVVPIGTLILIWTNPIHHLFRDSISISMKGEFPALQAHRGGAFWLHSTYSYILLIVGTFVFGYAFTKARGVYRRQAGIMLAGVIVPWIVNLLSVTSIFQVHYLDVTPFAFAFTGLIMSWGMFGFKFLDLAPIARERVVEHMADAMLVLDLKNRIVDINPAAAHLLRIRTREAIGLDVGEAFAEWPNWIEQLNSGLEVNTEVVMAASSGSRCFQLRVSSLFDRQKIGHGRLIILNEISEQKRIENELRAAKEAAEAASRAKSTFLANMSHELRTPLAAIMGYSELLQDQAVQAGYQAFVSRLEKINLASSQLLAIINDLLDLSKIEAGQMDLYPETFEVESVINNVIQIAQPLMAQNNNQLSITYSNKAGKIHTDQAKFRQIVLNLLSNAAKFTENGSVRLIIKRETAPHIGPESLVISVEDTGIGINEEHLNFLFRPFMQVDSSTTRRYGGTGLGLAISKRFAQMIGGDISVKSKANQGSTFLVRLPIICQGQPIMNPAQNQGESLKEQKADLERALTQSGRTEF